MQGRGGEVVIDKDEGPVKAKLDKIPALKPAFKKDGTITAASSSSINDGAAALVIMRESTAKKLGCTPIAKIVGHARHSQEPNWFTTAPIGAIEKLYEKTGWSTKEVDLFEINEAFAAVPMAAMKELGIGARQGQHPRRRLRAGSPDRRLRRAHHRDPDRRAEENRRQARRRFAVHRRRRSDRDGDRAGLRQPVVPAALSGNPASLSLAPLGAQIAKTLDSRLRGNDRKPVPVPS